MHLCHLDLKPGNIFLTDNELFSGERRAGSRLAEDDSSVVSSDDGFDEDLAEEDDEIIYKIGQSLGRSWWWECSECDESQGFVICFSLSPKRARYRLYWYRKPQ